MKKLTICINDAALGQWALEVSSISSSSTGYAFEDYDNATCILTGEVCTDEEFLHTLASYALEEGYEEQNISAQCAVLYEIGLAEEA